MTDASRYTVASARDAAAEDRLDVWVAEFLASPGSDNAELGRQLADGERWWLGPIRLPIDCLHRLAGPAGDPVLVAVEEDEWRDDVDELAAEVDDDEDLPPVVVSHRAGQLVLEDGNHRVEALRRVGRDRVWAVVAFEDLSDRDAFVEAASR